MELPLREFMPKPATIHTCGLFIVLSDRQTDDILSENFIGVNNSNRTASPE